MNISFILGHELPFPPQKGGGVNSLLMGLCKGFVSLGHNVTAYSPAKASLPNIETSDGVKHVRVKATERNPNNLYNFLSGIPYALRVKQALTDCDVLSCHLLHGFFYTNNSKAKIVTHTIHRDPKKFLYLFSHLDRIYSGSDSVTEDAKKVVPSISNKCKTIYNCVDFSYYSAPVARQRDGFIRFIFVGRFSKDKGLASFIPAFCKAAHQNQHISFLAIGPVTNESGGDEMFLNEMTNLVTSKKLSDRVEFRAPVFEREKLDQVIRDCDVVVLPSIGGETLNMSVLECTRLGKALLISDLIANKPLTQEGETGLFVKAGDEDSWTNKILDIASNIERIERFGLKSYQYGKRNFSCEKISEDYVCDFEELIKRKKK